MKELAVGLCIAIGVIAIVVAILWLGLFVFMEISELFGKSKWRAEKERLRSDMVYVRNWCNYEFPAVAETAKRVISELDNEDRETVDNFRDRLRKMKSKESENV